MNAGRNMKATEQVSVPAQSSFPGVRAGIYDTRILRKTHVPVSDTVSDTDTPRIRPDTYPGRIERFRHFQLIKITRILMGYRGIPVGYFKP